MTSARRFVATTFTALAVGVATTAMAQPAMAGTVTDYGFGGRGFGTELRGGPVGVSSGRTAEAMLGCTRETGERRHNRAAAVDTDGQGLSTTAINSTTRSYKTKKKFGERSTNRIAKVVIGDPNGLNITIEGLSTRSNASVNRRTGKFAAASSFKSADISAHTNSPLDDILGEVGAGIGDLLDEIRKNGPVEVPGLATVKLGSKNNKVNKKRAVAQASALRVILHGPDTRVGTDDDILAIVGKSRSTVKRGLQSGVFAGGAVPVQAQALGDLVKVGRLIHRPLPCEGTDGRAKTTSLAGGNLLLADVLGLGAAEATSWGKQRTNRSAKAWTRARIAGINLGDGALKVEGIVGRAFVKTNRKGKVTARNIKGSSIGSLTVNGDKQAIPDPGQAIEVPGVAKLQFFVRDRMKRGIKVTALRVTLLDGTGAVVDLGTARTVIKRS